MKTFLLFLASAVGASFVSAQSDMNPENTMREDFPSEQNEQSDPEQSRYGRHHGGWDGRRGGWDGRRGGWHGHHGGWHGHHGGWHGHHGGWHGHHGGWRGGW